MLDNFCSFDNFVSDINVQMGHKRPDRSIGIYVYFRHQGGGVKRTFSHAGFNTPTTSKKHSSFIQIDQGDKTNGVNNGSSDYRRTQSTPVHAANETLQSVEVDNGKVFR